MVLSRWIPSVRRLLLALLCFATAGCSGADSGGVDGGGSGSETSSSIEFSNLRAEEIGEKSAVIRFETNIETTCEVEYGLTESALDSSATDPDMDPDNPYDTLHNVPLEDLPPGTTVYYRAKATAPSGEVAFSELANFRTAVASGGGSPLDGMSNVALLSTGTTVSGVSSNFGGATDDANWGINAAFDGQMGTEWASAGDGDEAWVEIAFGEEMALSGFSFRSREMSDGSSIIQSVLLILDNGTELGPFMTPDPSLLYEFAFEETAMSASARIEAVTTTGGNTGAKEIGIFASSAGE